MNCQAAQEELRKIAGLLEKRGWIRNHDFFSRSGKPESIFGHYEALSLELKEKRPGMKRKIAALLLIGLTLGAVKAFAQTLPNDIPDVTANCPNVVAVGQTQAITTPTVLDCLAVKGRVEVTSKLSVGTITVYPGATFYCRKPAEIVFRSIAPVDPEQYSTGLLNFATWDCLGTFKTPWVRLSAELLHGGTVINVTPATVGWLVGDEISVTITNEQPDAAWGTSTTWPQPERFKIVSGSGTTWTLDHAANLDHVASWDADLKREFYPVVQNHTRDVKFYSENPSGVRGHILNSGDVKINVQNVEFRGLGRTKLGLVQPGVNQKGRYSVHMHMLSLLAVVFFNGNAIIDGTKWPLTVHSSHSGTYTSNVVTGGEGSVFMTEIGDERDNIIDGNSFSGATGTAQRADVSCSGDGAKGCDGSVAWLQGTMNTFTNNVMSNGITCLTVWSFANGAFQPIKKIDGNESVGCRDGVQLWETFGGGAIGHQKVWGVTENALFCYPTSDIQLNDWVIRGDPNRADHSGGLPRGIWCGDYANFNMQIARLNCQNMYTCVHYVYGTAGGRDPWWSAPQNEVVKDSVFNGNVIDLLWRQDGLSTQRDNPAFTALAMNNQHGPKSQTHVARKGPLQPVVNGAVTMKVQTYQGQPGDDFTVYSDETKPAGTISRPKVLDTLKGGTPPQQTTVTVNPSQTFQTMQNWEAAVLASIEDYSSIVNSGVLPAILQAAVNDLGINRVRLAVRNGIEGGANNFSPVNDNADPNVLDISKFNFTALDYQIDHFIVPLRGLVAARNEQFYIGLQYVDHSPGTGFEHSGAEYAEFMFAVFSHMKQKYGFVPNGIDVVNEPNNFSDWNPSRIGQAVVATAQKFQAEGLAVPEFILPSSVNISSAGDWFKQIVAIPGVLPLVKELSYHRYGGSTADLQAVAALCKQYNIRCSDLEYWGDFVTPNSGYNYEHFWQDLTLANVSAIQQGSFADYSSCVSEYYKVVNGAPQRCANTNLNRQIYKYVRPGAVRLGATSIDTNFEPVAFRNVDGKFVVAVKAATSGTISISGLPSGTYGAYWAPRNGGQPTDLPDLNVTTSATVSMPSDGAITVYGKTGGPPPPVDSDGDGVVDGSDKCPGTPAGQSVDSNGCAASQRDTDGDSVKDDVDKCPTQAGPASNNGCPVTPPVDTDGDGVNDDVDKCPTQPGPASNNGCPIPQSAFTVTATMKTCTYKASDVPPDSSGGWIVQFQRRAPGATLWTNQGQKDSSAPYERSADLGPGPWEFQAVWTKSGVTTVTRPLISLKCGG